jgi:hypothetical protein
MRLRHYGWACALALILPPLPAMAAQNFGYQCSPSRYGSVPIGTFTWETRSRIQGFSVSNDSVDVIFEPHIPGGWSAEWCHVLSGTCYFGNQRIGLVVGANDSLRIDFYPSGGTPAIGYVDMTIRSTADPLDVERCTYTLFYGKPVVNPVYIVDCTDNTRYVDPVGLDTEFFSPFRSDWASADSILAQLTSTVPSGWFTEFCQVSTGICYGDEGTMPLAAFARDTVRVDFYRFDTPGQGSADLYFHSLANPSITKNCHYLVFAGSYPAGAPEIVAGTPAHRVWAQPNPFRQGTALRMTSSRAGSGELSIFSADGRLVRHFAVDLSARAAQVQWDGRDAAGSPVPSGIYFCRLHAPDGQGQAVLVHTR